jgi:hypothetical protein
MESEEEEEELKGQSETQPTLSKCKDSIDYYYIRRLDEIQHYKRLKIYTRKKPHLPSFHTVAPFLLDSPPDL